LNDYLVARLRTSDGTPMWAIAGGGNPDSNDETRGLTVDRNGNPSVTGFLHPFSPPSSGTPFVNSGPTVLAAGYDASSGIARWIHNANDGLAAPNQPKHAGNGIALNLQGCVHIAGEFTEDLEFLPATTLNASAPGQSDMFVAKMCSQCCPGTPVLNYTVVGTSLQLTWEGVCCHLESTGELSGTPVWIFLGNTSPITVPMTGPQKFFRLVCP
jgi:hypothetical protein